MRPAEVSAFFFQTNLQIPEREGGFGRIISLSKLPFEVSLCDITLPHLSNPKPSLPQIRGERGGGDVGGGGMGGIIMTS